MHKRLLILALVVVVAAVSILVGLSRRNSPPETSQAAASQLAEEGLHISVITPVEATNLDIQEVGTGKTVSLPQAKLTSRIPQEIIDIIQND